MAINGSIKYLKHKKRNQYAVHPPTTEFTKDGVPITPKALCYVDDWYKGFAVLTAYKAGTYKPGMESELNFTGQKDDAVKRIISDYLNYRRIESQSRTFAEVYDLYYRSKYVDTRKDYSPSTLRTAKAAFRNSRLLHDKPFEQITIEDLQMTVDSCPLKHASLEQMVTLYKGMYAYAVGHGITDRDVSRYVKIKIPDDDVHGVPFSVDDLRKLWEMKAEVTPARIIVMCMTGYRIDAYRSLKITPDYLQGGNKTKYGKDVLIPIHERIKPLIPVADLPHIVPNSFRKQMRKFLQEKGFQDHTPHDCKHTFSMLCDKYKVNPVARKKMLGHSIQDMSNAVYGHWDYEMLKEEIEKIRVFD